VLAREVDDSFSLNNENAFGGREEPVGVPPVSCVERGRKINAGSDVLDQHLHSQGASGTLQFPYLEPAIESTRVEEWSKSVRLRRTWIECEKAEPRELLRRLRLGRERRGQDAGDCCDEGSPAGHWMI